MTRKLKITAFILIATTLAACAATEQPPANTAPATPAPAAPSASADPSDLSDFVGAKGGQAELGLQNRGYEVARTEGLTAYWFNEGTGDCAEIVTADGRYKSVTPVASAECTGEASASADTPTPAQEACLTAVSRETNNPEVVLLSSQFSEAGTLVQVGVGPQQAPWECIAYSDGSTAGIQSLTDEGKL